MPSFGTLKADTLTHSTAGSLATNFVVSGSAKSWVNIDMPNQTTNDSFNTSGVTDIATGRFTSGFTTNLANSDYAVTAGGMDPTEASTGGNRTADGTPVSSSSMYIRAAAYDNTANDVPGSGLVANGDLA